MTAVPRWSKMSARCARTRARRGSGWGEELHGANRRRDGARRKRRSIDLPSHCAIDFKYKQIGMRCFFVTLRWLSCGTRPEPYFILLWVPHERKNQLERHGHRWEGNIIFDFREIGRKDVELMHLAGNTDYGQPLVNKGANFLVPSNAVKFFTNYSPNSATTRTPHHGISYLGFPENLGSFLCTIFPLFYSLIHWYIIWYVLTAVGFPPGGSGQSTCTQIG